MKLYYYKLPVMKMSGAPVKLTSENGDDSGYMTRTFKSRLSKTMSWIIDSWEISFWAEAERCTIQLSDMWVWFGRNKWLVTCTVAGEEQQFMLEDKSVVRTNPRFVFTFNGQSFEVAKDLLDKRTRIMNKTQHKLCAEITSKSLSELYIRKITLYEEELNPLLVACIDRLLRTV
ncbi:tubby C-terminal domain-like protein [Paenibacillus lentus]|uniref:Tubby C-terminal domain-containing protein n=1 Tax=Paenibacillus lentus TaxID=1338368 RepID=A0A3Q8SD88_9BACL|nr:hypothetical protein [Paenibacillus lentus]AZK47892.1 hypothetical protein EIM92_18390 [Paenibacillus lentus]